MLKRIYILSAIVFTAITLLNIILYDYMLEQMPLLRGAMVEKTFYWSIRIQIINITTFIIAAIFCQAILRYKEFIRFLGAARTLLITILAKTVIEFSALFNKTYLEYSVILLLPVIIIGLSIAILNSKDVYTNSAWRIIELSFREKFSLITLFTAYLCMNIPVAIQMFTS